MRRPLGAWVEPMPGIHWLLLLRTPCWTSCRRNNYASARRRLAARSDPATGSPDADYTKRVQQQALKKGLLLLTCGVYGNVIRFLFPLTIEDKVFTEALAVLDAAFEIA